LLQPNFNFHVGLRELVLHGGLAGCVIEYF
jgi:hypothetical protein